MAVFLTYSTSGSQLFAMETQNNAGSQSNQSSHRQLILLISPSTLLLSALINETGLSE